MAIEGPFPVVATSAAVWPRAPFPAEALRTGVRVNAATPAANSAMNPARSNDIPQETRPWTRLWLRRRSPASRTTANAPMNDETAALNAPQIAAPALEATCREANGSMTESPRIMPISEKRSIAPQPMRVPAKSALQSSRTGGLRSADATAAALPLLSMDAIRTSGRSDPKTVESSRTRKQDTGVGGLPALAREQAADVALVPQHDHERHPAEAIEGRAIRREEGDAERNGHSGERSDAGDAEQLVEHEPGRGAGGRGGGRERERYAEPGRHSFAAAKPEPDRITVADHR